MTTISTESTFIAKLLLIINVTCCIVTAEPYTQVSESLVQSQKCENVLNGSEQVGFYWYQKRDIIGHTGIVLMLDKNPIYTIDFGGSLTYRSDLKQLLERFSRWTQTCLAGMSLSIRGGVAVNCFYHSESVVKGKIAKFHILTKKSKALVQRLITKLLNINMGEYKLLTNNCRAYVKKANKVIIRFWMENKNDFGCEKKDVGKKVAERLEIFNPTMNQILKMDKFKLSCAAGVTAAILGLLIVKRFRAYNRQHKQKKES